MRKRINSMTPRIAKGQIMLLAVVEEAVEVSPRHLLGMIVTSHQLPGLTVLTTTNRSQSSPRALARMTFKIASSSQKSRTWVGAAEARIASTVRLILTSNNSVTMTKFKMLHTILFSSRMAKMEIVSAVLSSATHVTISKKSLRKPRTLRSRDFSTGEIAMILRMARRGNSS